MKIDIDKNSNFVIAADIGGTNIRVSLVDRKGTIVKKKKVAYDPSIGIDKAGLLITELSEEICKNDSIFGMGYSSAGTLNQLMENILILLI